MKPNTVLALLAPRVAPGFGRAVVRLLYVYCVCDAVARAHLNHRQGRHPYAPAWLGLKRLASIATLARALGPLLRLIPVCFAYIYIYNIPQSEYDDVAVHCVLYCLIVPC